jgi:hypothetical protein
MMRGQLLRHEEQLRVGQLNRWWHIQGWLVLRALLKRGRNFYWDVRATTSPRVIDVDPISARPVGVMTWSRTSHKLINYREVRGHLAHRDPNLLFQA